MLTVHPLNNSQRESVSLRRSQDRVSKPCAHHVHGARSCLRIAQNFFNLEITYMLQNKMMQMSASSKNTRVRGRGFQRNRCLRDGALQFTQIRWLLANLGN
jgi:hypothetical protein